MVFDGDPLQGWSGIPAFTPLVYAHVGRSKGMNREKITEILKQKRPNELFEAVCDLYREVRFIDVAEEDGDMLLYQYGVFEWEKGKLFELDLTRQLMRKDGEITQIRAILQFNANDELTKLGGSNFWCSTPNELDSFVIRIENSEAYKTCRSLVPLSVVVENENV